VLCVDFGDQLFLEFDWFGVGVVDVEECDIVFDLCQYDV